MLPSNEKIIAINFLIFAIGLLWVDILNTERASLSVHLKAKMKGAGAEYHLLVLVFYHDYPNIKLVAKYF